MRAPSRLFRAKWRLRNREESRLIHIPSVLDRWRVVSKPESEMGSVLTNRQSCVCKSCYSEPHISCTTAKNSKHMAVTADLCATKGYIDDKRLNDRNAEITSSSSYPQLGPEPVSVSLAYSGLFSESALTRVLKTLCRLVVT